MIKLLQVCCLGILLVAIPAFAFAGRHTDPPSNIPLSFGIDQTVTFGTLSAMCPNGTMLLSATASSGLPVSFATSNSSIATISGNTLTAVGSGTVTIIAYQLGDATYNYASTPQTLIVNVKPTVTNTNFTTCSQYGTYLTLTSDVPGSTFSYTVYAKSANVSGIEAGPDIYTTNPISMSPTTTNTSSGTVTFRVTATSPNGCVSIYKDIIQTITGKVTTGTVGTEQTICPLGNPAAFTASGTPTGPGTLAYEWQYSTDGGETFASFSPAVTTSTYDVPNGVLTESRVYKRVVKYTSLGITCNYTTPTTGGSTTNLAIVVFVRKLLPGSITGNQTVCYNGDPSTITSTTAPSSPDGYSMTYSWQKSTNGGSTWATISGATSLTYNPPVITQTTLYRRVASTTSCSGMSAATTPVTITVQVPDGTITPTSSLNVCPGDPISIVMNAVALTGYTYVWKKDGTTVQSGSSATYTATALGNYTVTVTSTLGCTNTGGTKSVVNPVGQISQSGDLCLLGYVDLTVVNSSGTGILWSNSETTPTIRVYSNGVNESFTVTYTTSEGCAVSASTTVVFYQPPGSPCIYFRQASPNEPQELEEPGSDISLYPNPANDKLEITLPTGSDAKAFTLYDSFGHSLQEKNINSRKVSISTAELRAGIYFVHFLHVNGKKSVRKVLVKH